MEFVYESTTQWFFNGLNTRFFARLCRQNRRAEQGAKRLGGDRRGGGKRRAIEHRGSSGRYVPLRSRGLVSKKIFQDQGRIQRRERPRSGSPGHARATIRDLQLGPLHRRNEFSSWGSQA